LEDRVNQTEGRRDPWTKSTYPVFNDAQLAEFEQKGYLVVRGLLSQDEVAKFKSTMLTDAKVAGTERFVREDRAGKKVDLTIINTPGKNLYGALARSGRLIDNFERLLKDECYHYHFKTIRIEPKVGGSFEWHQDYGYWYDNG
jgi:ectoine hydroxylase